MFVDIHFVDIHLYFGNKRCDKILGLCRTIKDVKVAPFDVVAVSSLNSGWLGACTGVEILCCWWDWFA